MNIAVASKKFKCQFHSGNFMALTTNRRRPLFVFRKIGAQEQHVVQYGIAHTRS